MFEAVSSTVPRAGDPDPRAPRRPAAPGLLAALLASALLLPSSLPGIPGPGPPAPSVPSRSGAADGRTVLIVDSPSGVNRFVEAVRSRGDSLPDADRVRWMVRSTRQLREASPDTVAAWLERADQAIVRLAFDETAARLREALRRSDGLPPLFWLYHSETDLLRRSRTPGAGAVLEGLGTAAIRRAVEEGELPEDASPGLRAWRRGLDYLSAMGTTNARRLLRFLDAVAARGAGSALSSSPEVVPTPDAARYRLEKGDSAVVRGGAPDTAARPAVGILDFDNYVLNGEASLLDSLSAALRRRGLRPVPVYAGWGEATVRAVREHFFRNGEPAVSAIVSLQSFVLGGGEARSVADSLLSRLDVPLFRAIRLTGTRPEEWALSSEGLPWTDLYHQLAMPELQGAIEPLVVAAETTAPRDSLTGAEPAIYAPLPRQVEVMARRVDRWLDLRRTPPGEKKLAVIYYNHPPGKQNIGADNLNVTGSIVRLLELLEARGYDVGEATKRSWGRNPDSLAAVLTRRGLNVGEYGEGVLDSLVARGARLVPADVYREWYGDLPRLVRREVAEGPLGYLEARLQSFREGELDPVTRPAAAKERRTAARRRLREEVERVVEQMRGFFDAVPAGDTAPALAGERLSEARETALAVLEGRAPPERFREAKRAFLDLDIEALSGWGPPPGDVMTVRRDGEEHLVIPGLVAGNVFIGPQPQRGFHADPEKVHASTLVSPPHQYLAYYAWLERRFGADALVHMGRHSSYEWLPRKEVGMSAADHPVAVLHGLPSVYPYTMDGVGEGLQAKRRGLAAVVDHLTPPLKTTDPYGGLLELQQLQDSYHEQEAPDRKREIVRMVRKRLRGERFRDLRRAIEAEAGGTPVGEMAPDLLVHELGHEIEAYRSTMMPYGLHTLAEPWSREERRMLARSMASLQGDSTGPGAASREDSIRRRALRDIDRSFRREAEGVLDALDGRRVPPAPGNDPVRNPDALPTGANFYGVDPSLMPTRFAARIGRHMAERSLARLRRERSDSTYTPERVSAVLWAVEASRDEGAMVGFALHMLGLRPRWDARGKVEGLRRVPPDSLGRPRVDVTLVTSGLFRDLFSPALQLLDGGFQLALAGSAERILDRRPGLEAALRGALSGVPRDRWSDEPLDRNRVASHWVSSLTSGPGTGAGGGRQEGAGPDSLSGTSGAERGRAALSRIFGPAPGDYGAGINYLVSQPWTWRSRGELGRHYLRHMSHAYGETGGGRSAGASEFARRLQGTAAAYHSRSSNLYGVIDNDDFFDFFGGLSLAVEEATGRPPRSYVLEASDPTRLRVDRLETYLGRELRVRYLNPEWIRGQMEEGYDGARTVSNKFAEFLWGWQVTNPGIVRDWMWREVQDVYFRDAHDLGVTEWLSGGERAFAMQNMASVLLTAAKEGYWDASASRLRSLSNRLARLTREHGTACSPHLCGDRELRTFAMKRMEPELRRAFRRSMSAALGDGVSVGGGVRRRQGSPGPSPDADAAEPSRRPAENRGGTDASGGGRAERSPGETRRSDRRTDGERAREAPDPSEREAEIYRVRRREAGDRPGDTVLRGAAAGALFGLLFAAGVYRGLRAPPSSADTEAPPFGSGSGSTSATRGRRDHQTGEAR